nr:MAG TPA: hypothetical protein [Caudoviricetes sp.]
MCLTASTRKSWRLPRLRPRRDRHNSNTCIGDS